VIVSRCALGSFEKVLGRNLDAVLAVVFIITLD
jgi:hypothetical protein